MSSWIVIWIKYWNRRFAKPGGPDRTAAEPLDSKECHVANRGLVHHFAMLLACGPG